MDVKYEYGGIPITPNIIAELIIHLFQGKTIKRDIIINQVNNYHVQNGGYKAEAQDLTGSVKKALTRLKNKGKVLNNAKNGYWTVLPTTEFAISPDEKEKTLIDIDIEKLPTHKTYGTGTGSVYLYYFSNYKKFAESTGVEFWRCKIGMADKDPLLRAISQASTALPEKPTIEFIIRTDQPSALEKSIHNILHLRNRFCNDTTGIEWFNTNPDEVIEIVRFINLCIL